ncbi:MAG: MBL fold metallo-hydrolase [Treponema sp.]|nr:MBL fold metallo-hydrolase [Treponema sp.]
MDNINSLRLRFLGAIGTVTGSCTLIEYYSCETNEKKYFLVDAGAFQNETNNEQEFERTKVLKRYAKNIEKIFITHAHYDHIGLLPEIIKYGFKGEICCTKATHELIKIMLTDGEDNRDNDIILGQVSYFDIDKDYGEKYFKGFGKTYHTITKDFIYGFLRSSHVIGSCSIYFQWCENVYEENYPNENKLWKYVYFSGDIGSVSYDFMQNILFKGYQFPYWDKNNKHIILESTYGNGIRDKENLFQRKIEKLTEIIDNSIINAGTVLIPAFSLDRSQQILVDLLYITMNKKEKHKENWKLILNCIYSDICLNEVIDKLSGSKKNIRDFKDNFKKICQKNAINPNEIYFNELDNKIQNMIIELICKYNIEKQIKTFYNFYDILIAKVLNGNTPYNINLGKNIREQQKAKMKKILEKYEIIPHKTFIIEIIQKYNSNFKRDIVNLINELCENNKIGITNEIINIFYDDTYNYVCESIIDSFIFSFESPLIGKINNVYLDNITDDYFNDKDKVRKFKYLSKDFLKYFKIDGKDHSEQKKSVKELFSDLFDKKEGCDVLISSSGMCDKGSVIPLLKKYLPDEKATIILSGFQASNTNGFLLKNLLNNKYEENNEKKKIKISLKNEDILLSEVKCNIVDMSLYYSGHADQEQLVSYVTPDEKNSGEITVLINHGSDNSRELLKNEIEKSNKDTKVILPEFNKWFNLNKNEQEEPEEININDKENNYFNFTRIGNIHIYFQNDYDKEKIDSIKEFITKLE